MKIEDSAKGSGGHGYGRLVDFKPFGVFNLASNADKSFEAQAFICPWSNTRAPGVGAGIAVRFGEDIVHIMKGEVSGTHERIWSHRGTIRADSSSFFLNGKAITWAELGNATGIRGSNVPDSGEQGVTTSSLFFQQERATGRHNNNLPTCVGNNRDTLVEVGVRGMYWQDVTIRSNAPGAPTIDSGICSTPNGQMSADNHEAYRVEGHKNLFTTRQMKHLCQVCGLEMHHEKWGDTCGGPGIPILPEEVCTRTGSNIEEVKAACSEAFPNEGDDWFGACVMEACASGDGAVAIARIEEQLQELLIAEE